MFRRCGNAVADVHTHSMIWRVILQESVAGAGSASGDTNEQQVQF